MNLTQDQIDNVQIDYGILYLNYGVAGERLLGPTRGGGDFKATAKIREIDFDGSRGKTKGMQVVDGIDASLGVTLLDTSMDNLAMAMPYADYSAGAITAKQSNIGIIPGSTYINNITEFCKTIGGGYKKITLYNAMAEGDFSLAAKPKAEGEIKLEIFAHFDATDDTANLYKIEDVVSISADNTPPTIITTPADAAINVVVSSNLTAVFNENIRQSDIKSGNFILIKASDGTIVPGALSYTLATKTALFDPTSSLTAGTAYIWTIANVRDTAGNVLGTVVVNFTTA